MRNGAPFPKCHCQVELRFLPSPFCPSTIGSRAARSCAQLCPSTDLPLLCRIAASLPSSSTLVQPAVESEGNQMLPSLPRPEHIANILSAEVSQCCREAGLAATEAGHGAG